MFAASWSIGFVLGVLPAGAGPREAAFILLFSATMPAAQATVLALEQVELPVHGVREASSPEPHASSR